MALGQPALATWSPTDQNIRMFRLSVSGWVQTGIVAMSHLASLVNCRPWLGFVRDSTYLIGFSQANNIAANVRLQSFDLDLNLKFTLGTLPPGTVDTDMRCANPKYPAVSHIHVSKSAVTSVGQYPILVDGSFGGSTSLFGANHGPAKAQSDLGDFMYIDVSTTSHRTIPRSGLNATYGDPVFANGGPQTFPGSLLPADCCFAHNSQFIYFLYQSTTNRIDIYPYADANGFSTTVAATISETGIGTVAEMSVRPNDRHIAVSWLNGSTYTTNLYRRVGTSFAKVSTISGMGKKLDWTEDSKYLIDAPNKKMYEVSDDGATLTDRSTWMSNVPSGIEIQTISTHAITPSSEAKVYTTGLDALVNNTATLTNLKLMLLNATAVFDPSQTTISQVSNSNSYQVSGSNWTAGGELLTGVGKETVDNGLTFRWKANVLQKTILTTALTFRKAVIYDATSSKPLIFLDFLADYVAPVDTALKFDLATNGFVKFST